MRLPKVGSGLPGPSLVANPAYHQKEAQSEGAESHFPGWGDFEMTKTSREDGLDQWNLPDILYDMAVYFSESGTSVPMYPEDRRAPTLATEELRSLDPVYQSTSYMFDEASFQQHRS